MKQDNLEKFVNENRDEFDNLEPTDRVWDSIRKNEPNRKNHRWLKISMQAAAAVLIFVCAYYFRDFVNEKDSKQDLVVVHKVKIELQKQVVAEKKDKPQVQSEKQLAEVKTKKNNNIFHKNNVKKQASFENKELAEASAYYNDEIQKKRKELMKCTSGNPDVTKEINNEFGQLDKAFKELQSDLKENVDNQQVIDAMIQNYRMKLEVLEYMKTHVCTAELK